MNTDINKEVQTKFCKKCGGYLPLTMFCKKIAAKDKLNSVCRTCDQARKSNSWYNDEVSRARIKEANREWYINNREHAIKTCKSNSLKHPDRHKNMMLKITYGITIEDFKSMRDAQGYKCKICQRHEDELIRTLVVDHDHATGKIRGLLCNKCNLGLGMFNDNVELFNKAIEYLNQTK